MAWMKTKGLGGLAKAFSKQTQSEGHMPGPKVELDPKSLKPAPKPEVKREQ